MPEQLKDTIRKETFDATKEEVTKRLKEFWSGLGVVFTLNKTPLFATAPSDSELRIISESLIRYRRATFKLADGKEQPFNIDQIDDMIAKLSEEKKKNIEPLRTQIPRLETINNIADSTTKGVESQSGFSFNSIGNFFQGILLWISSLFSEKKLGFWEAIAQASAPNIKGAVKGELHQLATNNPAAAKLLYKIDENNRTTMDAIGDDVVAGTYKKMGAPLPANLKPPSKKTLAEIAPASADVPSESVLRQTILNTILGVDRNGDPLIGSDGQPKKSLKTTIAEQLKPIVGEKVSKMWFISWFTSDAMKAEKTKTIANTMADTLAPAVAQEITSVVTDPYLKNAAGKTPADKREFAQLAADKVIENLLKQSEKLNLPEGLAEKLEPVKNELRKQIEENYDFIDTARTLMLPNTSESEKKARDDASSGVTPTTLVTPNPDGKKPGELVIPAATGGNPAHTASKTVMNAARSTT